MSELAIVVLAIVVVGDLSCAIFIIVAAVLGVVLSLFLAIKVICSGTERRRRSKAAFEVSPHEQRANLAPRRSDEPIPSSSDPMLAKLTLDPDDEPEPEPKQID